VPEEKRSFDFAQDDRMIGVSLQVSDEPEKNRVLQAILFVVTDTSPCQDRHKSLS